MRKHKDRYRHGERKVILEPDGRALRKWPAGKNGVAKEAIVIQWAVRTASWDFKPGKKRWSGSLLGGKCCGLCETHRERTGKFELARLKRLDKHFGHLATFWFGTFAMLFSCYNNLLFIFECFMMKRFWRILIGISIYYASALSLHIESTDSMIPVYLQVWCLCGQVVVLKCA